MAVMFAMICSFILSRTLVPTMANYLLQPHVASRAAGSRRRAIRWCASSAASRRASSAFRAAYRDLLAMALGQPAAVHHRLPGRGRRCRSLLVPFLGRNFFPSVDAGQILMHVRTQVGTRVEETANQLADIQKAIRQIIPPREIETHGRQHRHAGPAST